MKVINGVKNQLSKHKRDSNKQALDENLYKEFAEAAWHGQTKLIEQLLDKGADVRANNDVALLFAASNGHTASVELLLNRGADVHSENDSAISQAANSGHTETVELLLDRGADIHANNDWALTRAAFEGRTATVKLLLDRGADIHIKNDVALYCAADQGHTETTSLMLIEYNMKIKPETRDFLKKKAPDTFKILEKRDLSEKLKATLKPKSAQQERVMKI